MKKTRESDHIKWGAAEFNMDESVAFEYINYIIRMTEAKDTY